MLCNNWWRLWNARSTTLDWSRPCVQTAFAEHWSRMHARDVVAKEATPSRSLIRCFIMLILEEVRRFSTLHMGWRPLPPCPAALCGPNSAVPENSALRACNWSASLMRLWCRRNSRCMSHTICRYSFMTLFLIPGVRLGNTLLLIMESRVWSLCSTLLRLESELHFLVTLDAFTSLFCAMGGTPLCSTQGWRCKGEPEPSIFSNNKPSDQSRDKELTSKHHALSSLAAFRVSNLDASPHILSCVLDGNFRNANPSPESDIMYAWEFKGPAEQNLPCLSISNVVISLQWRYCFSLKLVILISLIKLIDCKSYSQQAISLFLCQQSKDSEHNLRHDGKWRIPSAGSSCRDRCHDNNVNTCRGVWRTSLRSFNVDRSLQEAPRKSIGWC